MIPRISTLTFMSHLPYCKHMRLWFHRYPLMNIYMENRITMYMDHVFAVLVIRELVRFYQLDRCSTSGGEPA